MAKDGTDILVENADGVVYICKTPSNAERLQQGRYIASVSLYVSAAILLYPKEGVFDALDSSIQKNHFKSALSIGSIFASFFDCSISV